MTPLLRDLHRLHHGPQLLLRGQFQHTQHLGPTADMAGADTAAVGHEGVRFELREGFVRQTDLVESRVDLADGQVGADVERVRHVRGVEHEVEFELERVGPGVGVVGDEVRGAERQRVRLLVRRVRDHRHFGAQRGRVDDGEVPETAEPDDRDFLAGGDVGAHERRPDCETCGW